MRTPLVALAVGIVLLPHNIVAQGRTRPVMAVVKDCKETEGILATGKPGKQESWAYGVIGQCPNGAARLAGAWHDPPTDSTTLHDLLSGTLAVADRRLVDALLIAVRNASLPLEVRKAAIDGLLSQYGKDLRIAYGAWNDLKEMILVRELDVYQAVGEQPVSPADRGRIASTFRQLGVSDPDARVRTISASVARRLCGLNC